MIENFILRLNGVKKTGPQRYIARCPAHDDKSPSLAIQQADDKVLFHCFAGCAPTDVLAAVGLTFNDLYPERVSYRKPNQSKFNPYDVLKCLTRESGIVTLAAAQIVAGKSLSAVDAERVQLAHERLYEAVQFLGIHV